MGPASVGQLPVAAAREESSVAQRRRLGHDTRPFRFGGATCISPASRDAPPVTHNGRREPARDYNTSKKPLTRRRVASALPALHFRVSGLAHNALLQLQAAPSKRKPTFGHARRHPQCRSRPMCHSPADMIRPSPPANPSADTGPCVGLSFP